MPLTKIIFTGICLVARLASAATVAYAARAQSAPENPATLLVRAQSVMRVNRVSSSHILHLRSYSSNEQNFMSDRTYPPFFSSMDVEESWYDPKTNIERISRQSAYPGSGISPAQVILMDSARAYAIAGERTVPLPSTALQPHYLNPWAVIADWLAVDSAGLTVTTEIYRDYPRSVLTRQSSLGPERLFLDSKSGFPVKLEFEERHYLWGQRHIEYVYTTWTLVGGVMVPGASFRLADGKIEISRTIAAADILRPAAAPALSVPADSGKPPDDLPRFLQPIDPQVTQVGPQTYLLTNPGYSEAITAVGDEVFLFDATQGEERAKKDAAIIARLFPNHKKLTLIVTDLAWPHVAGLRYWVASGATVISHRASREFLQSIIDRRWTVAPDLLEQRRATAKLNFVAVGAVYKLAGDAIALYPIDGIGSEVALMAYLTPDKFLWASDFIQTLDEPASYTTEVWRATQRESIHPERVAAEHLPLSPWSKIETLAAQDENRAAPN